MHSKVILLTLLLAGSLQGATLEKVAPVVPYRIWEILPLSKIAGIFCDPQRIPATREAQPYTGTFPKILPIENMWRRPSFYWSAEHGPVVEAEHAAAWEQAMVDTDEENTATVASALEVSTLKIVAPCPVDMRGTNDVPLRALLLKHKADGYNAVLLPWWSGKPYQQVARLATWAKPRFDAVIIAPVPSQYSKEVSTFPSRTKARMAVSNILAVADAVVLGWGWTIDTVKYGDVETEMFCKRWFRLIERQAVEQNVPMWGNVFTRFHGSHESYVYAPSNMNAYVVGNAAPAQQFMAVKPSVLASRIEAVVPAGKPVVLGPFYGGNADKLVNVYNGLGYGAVRLGDRL